MSNKMFLISSTSGLLLCAIILFFGQTQTVDAWWLFAEPTGPIKAIAEFDLDGVKGTFKFNQKSLADPTIIEYNLNGLKGNNKFYHVHLNPVPAYDASKVKNNATAVTKLCVNPIIGGHLNPYNITEKLPPKAGPLDKYEVGDLGGKHGPLIQVFGPAYDDHYEGSFTDSQLPMSGASSIIGRSIVIHKNDGRRWVCASIKQVTV